MEVEVKFSDVEFGLFKPAFNVTGKDGKVYLGAYLDFTANNIPWRQLVLEESIRGKERTSTLEESPVYASPNDDVYYLIERILECERECGEEIEIKYIGEDNDMMEKTIKRGRSDRPA